MDCVKPVNDEEVENENLFYTSKDRCPSRVRDACRNGKKRLCGFSRNDKQRELIAARFSSLVCSFRRLIGGA